MDRPFEPAEVPGSEDTGWVLSSTAEAVGRQPFPCHRMDHFQMGTTGQPGQPIAPFTRRHTPAHTTGGSQLAGYALAWK